MVRMENPRDWLLGLSITLTPDDGAEIANRQKSQKQPVPHLTLKNLHRIFCLLHEVQQLPGNRERMENKSVLSSRRGKRTTLA